MKTAVAILAVLLAAMAGSQALLPEFVEKQMAAGITQSLDDAEAVHVNISSFPAVELLQGTVDDLTVDVREAVMSGLTIEAFLVDAHNLKLDMAALRQRNELIVQAADALTVTATVAEADLNAYFAQVSGTSNMKVKLDPAETTLTGDVSVLGRPVEVTVKGHFSITGPTRVAFVVDDLLLMQTRLPKFIVEPLAGNWGAEFDLAKAPLPLAITDLRIEKERLYIYGQRPEELPAAPASVQGNESDT